MKTIAITSFAKRAAFVLLGLVATACQATTLTPIDEEENLPLSACDPEDYSLGAPRLEPMQNIGVRGYLGDVSAFSCEAVNGGRLPNNDHNTWVEVKCSGDSADGHWEMWIRSVFFGHIPAHIYEPGKTVHWDPSINAQENVSLVMVASASLDCEDRGFSGANATDAVISDAGNGLLHFVVTGTFDGSGNNGAGEVVMEFDIAPDPI